MSCSATGQGTESSLYVQIPRAYFPITPKYLPKKNEFPHQAWYLGSSVGNSPKIPHFKLHGSVLHR